jgi:carbonic anhydrase
MLESFVKEKKKCIFMELTEERRKELAKKQEPIAVIVSCSDSRVPPELIFNQNIGDLFVIRTAGQVIDATALGSIEFAIESLNVSLIVVLGHENCGAIEATLKVLDTGIAFNNHIQNIVNKVIPALTELKNYKGAKAISDAVSAHVHYVANKIRDSHPVIYKYVKQQKVKVVGFKYDLNSGKICLVSE